MPAILPALIFLGGSVFIPFIKGRARQVYLMTIAFIALVDVFTLKIQTSWVTDFIGFKITLLHADRISLFVGYIFVIISFFAILYTIHVEETWHHMLTFWYIGTSLGAVFAGDLLSLYVFWELMAVTSVGLIFLNRSDEARQAAFRYLLMHIIGGAVFVGGILVHFMQTGSLAISPLASGWAFGLVLFGIGMNAGFILIHTWLPDSYPRALFTGSIFMSVYTTKTAVYAIVRLVPGWDIVAYLGAIMAVFGVTMALIQSNPRKLLSYHIISQVGYIVAAIGLGGALGVDGGLLHLFNNILYKTLLFMAIGAVIYRTGKNDLTEMGGVFKKMPITTAAAVIGALSISGVPLFAGFISKSLIFTAAEGNEIIELMLELAAVGTFLSFLKFTYFGFFRPNKSNEAKATEAPTHMLVAMGSIAALCLAVGLAPQYFVRILPFALTVEETSFYVLPKLLGITQILVVTSVLFVLALPVFSPHKRRTYDFDWFYIQASKGLALAAQGVSVTNNAFESATGKIIPALRVISKPLNKLNDLMSRLLFAIFVDMWLFKPVTPPVRDAGKGSGNVTVRPHVIETIAQIGEKTSVKVGKIDLKIIDKLIDQFAKIGGRLSNLANSFDSKVVDGIVNGVGWLAGAISKKIRPMQTGDVQTYGLVMIAGAFFILVFFALVFYGLLNLS